MSDKRVSDMTDDEIRAMAGVSRTQQRGLDWPAARRAIDIAISRARREIEETVLAELGNWGLDAVSSQCIEETILSQVQDSLDDIDQTIPPEADDGS